MPMIEITKPSKHARPSHRFETPRLIIRSGWPADAVAIEAIRSNPLNNPFGGVHEPDKSIEQVIKSLEAQRITTAEGENAWMIMIIKPEILSPDENGKANNANVTELIVKEGICIGNTGFNCFPLRPSLKGASKHVIMGDTGAMVDYRVARQGYALETQTAVIEYGFKELGCGMMSIDTAETNGPWRALMRTMGLGDGELEVHEGDVENEIHWKFDLEDWEKAKEHMKRNGKWLL